MAILRRNPDLSCALGLLVCSLVATVLVVWPRGTPALAGEPEYEPLDAVTAAQMEALRHGAGLDDDLLVCLNLDEPRLETLLAGVRAWFERSGAGWLAATEAVSLQRATIRELRVDQLNGLDPGMSLVGAEQDLARLETAQDAQLAALRAALGATFSPGQIALLEQMRARAGVPMPFRVLNLTPEQDQAVAKATRRYHQRLALAHNTQSNAALAGDYVRELETAIGAANLRTLSDLRSYRTVAAERLVAVLKRVFPVNPEG